MTLAKSIPNIVPTKPVDIGKHLAMQKGIHRYPLPEVELFILPNFLSGEECRRVMEAMAGAWKPSAIADDIGVNNYRTSETCQMDSTNPVVATLEDRIHALTGINPLHGEPIQGQRYAVGQEFKEHTDYFEPDGADFERFCSKSGQRTWTVMMYLNQPEAGGVTFFKRLGIGIKPTAGTLVAWNNMTRDGRPNGSTLHHGMPVEKGTKYILTKWFRERPWPWPEEIAQRLKSGRRFDGTPSAKLDIERPARPAEMRVVPESQIHDSTQTALRRREWVLAVKEKMVGLIDNPRTVQRVRNLSSEAFLRDYYAAGRPVIIQGEMDDWPALRLWNRDYLRSKVGPAPIEFQGRRNASGQFELQKDAHKHRLPFDEYMDLISSNPGNDAYITAYNSGMNRDAFKCLSADVRPLSKFLRGNFGLIWIGPIGTYTPLHHDLTNNMIAQVAGSKRFIMVPPSETRLLYNHRHVFSAVHDIMDEDALQKYPLAREAITYEIDLESGELLFIPIGWWHQVTSLDFSVSFTFTDFLWDNDFHDTFPSD